MKVFLIFLCLPLFLKGSTYHDNHSFDYENANLDWPVDYKSCKGKHQSPIDIETSKVDSEYSNPLIVKTTYSRQFDLAMQNNGHTLLVNGHMGNLFIYDKRYEMINLHFHQFGEHIIDGKRSVMEMHLVHKNPNNPQTDLLVLGLRFHIDPVDRDNAF